MPRRPNATVLMTPAADKRHIIYDAGHVGLPRNQVVAQMVDWLDKYLGLTQESPPIFGRRCMALTPALSQGEREKPERVLRQPRSGTTA